MCPPRPRQTGKTRPIPQTGEMRVRAETHRIPGSGIRKQHHPDGPHQDQGSSRMAVPEKPHGRPLFPRLYWVLPLLHSQLLTRRTTPAGLDEESDPVDLGRSPNKSLRNPENTHVHKTSADPTAIRQAIRTSHRRISIWRGRHTLTRGRYQPTKTLETPPPPDRLLLSYVHTD